MFWFEIKIWCDLFDKEKVFHCGNAMDIVCIPFTLLLFMCNKFNQVRKWIWHDTSCKQYDVGLLLQFITYIDQSDPFQFKMCYLLSIIINLCQCVLASIDKM